MNPKNNPITRRTLLRGVGGVAMGLPFLDAMMLSRAMAGEAAQQPPVRMAILYMANGVVPEYWTPEGEGTDFQLSPILQPLEKVKDDVVVLSELSNAAAKQGSEPHTHGVAGFLTGTLATKLEGSGVSINGVSMDQVAAQEIGRRTPIPSLELAVEPLLQGMTMKNQYSRIYRCHISWSRPTTPVTRELNPKTVFDRIFGRGSQGGESQDDRSVLDVVLGDAQRLHSQVGAADQRKLDEYLESVRSVEKRIAEDARQRARLYESDPAIRQVIDAVGTEAELLNVTPERMRNVRDAAAAVDPAAHMRIMIDLMVLAFWSGATRIGSLMMAYESSGKNFSFLHGLRGGHLHDISHYRGDPAKKDAYRDICAWHVAQYAYMLQRMKEVREGEGTLLDNSMVVFGSSLRDSATHTLDNLPIVLAGRAGGTIKPGRHIVCPGGTPLCNLWQAMLTRMGCQVDRFADSTGPLAELA